MSTSSQVSLAGREPASPTIRAASSAGRAPKVLLFVTSDHRVWTIDPAMQPLLDAAGHCWTWDGEPFEKESGPCLRRLDDPSLVAPLAELAERADLHSVRVVPDRVSS